MDIPGKRTNLSHKQLSGEELPEDLQQIARYYAALPSPQPDRSDTERLLARLAMEARVQPEKVTQKISMPSPLRIAVWRLRLLGPTFWCVMAGTLLLGISVASDAGPAVATKMLIIFLPVIPVFCLGFVLRVSAPGLREIEASCPVGMMEIATSLALVITILTCLLGFLATAEAALLQWTSFLALLSAWLAPVVCLTAISLPIALRWGTRTAMLIGGLPWLVLTLSASPNFLSVLNYVTMVPQENVSLLVHLFASIIGLGALFGFFIYSSRKHILLQFTYL